MALEAIYMYTVLYNAKSRQVEVVCKPFSVILKRQTGVKRTTNDRSRAVCKHTSNIRLSRLCTCEHLSTTSNRFDDRGIGVDCKHSRNQLMLTQFS